MDRVRLTRTDVAARTAAAARLLFVGVCLLGCCMPRAALADPTPQPIVPPSIPSSVLSNPLVQSALNAVGGLTQTTNGANAIGKVTYFKQFDLQLQTAPTVYRKVRLHQGTVINPRGSTIGTGISLEVTGSPQPDGSLNADAITLR